MASLLVSIRDCRHSKKDRQWIQDVYGEYLDGLSGLNTGLFSVLGADNPHEHEIFANWFANDHSHPLLILKGSDAVGFALVTRPRIPAAGETAADYHMSEFFVRKALPPDGYRSRCGHADLRPLRRGLGDRRLSAQSRRGGILAARAERLHPGPIYGASRNGEVHQRFTSGRADASRSPRLAGSADFLGRRHRFRRGNGAQVWRSADSGVRLPPADAAPLTSAHV